MNLDRRDFAIRDIGCIACLLFGAGRVPCEKHHLNGGDQPGRKRRGERYTVGLCQWHHVGRCWCAGFPVERDCPTCKATRGPSWRHHKREFIERFGTGDDLLAYQETLLQRWAKGSHYPG